MTVRMFAGYANTPLWSVGGPVALAELDLPDDLRTGLVRWEADSYGGDGLLGDVSSAYGGVLAEWLAGELGAGVEVHLRTGSAEDPLVFTSTVPPRSPAAAAMLLHEAAEERALHAQLSTGRWYAYAPLSGATFSGYPDTPRSPDDHDDGDAFPVSF